MHGWILATVHNAGLIPVSEEEIRIALKAEQEEQRLKGTMRARMDFLDLE